MRINEPAIAYADTLSGPADWGLSDKSTRPHMLVVGPRETTAPLLRSIIDAAVSQPTPAQSVPWLHLGATRIDHPSVHSIAAIGPNTADNARRFITGLHAEMVARYDMVAYRHELASVPLFGVCIEHLDLILEQWARLGMETEQSLLNLFGSVLALVRSVGGRILISRGLPAESERILDRRGLLHLADFGTRLLTGPIPADLSVPSLAAALFNAPTPLEDLADAGTAIISGPESRPIAAQLHTAAARTAAGGPKLFSASDTPPMLFYNHEFAALIAELVGSGVPHESPNHHG